MLQEDILESIRKNYGNDFSDICRLLTRVDPRERRSPNQLIKQYDAVMKTFNGDNGKFLKGNKIYLYI